ncbi:MAG TPA: tail fiber protein [Pyrinomonadaceae bacterium]|jgi:microcystin-dependent protein|nr:tail fiber protein [Pyrinomonadaceae bacterium]
MAEPFLSEIRIFSFNFPPKGWAFCNGQFLPINQNQALFSLLGTTYGGNGQTTFALPNLRGQVPISFGNGFTLGQAGGQSSHTVTMSELPQHPHTLNSNLCIGGNVINAALGDPTGNYWANNGKAQYSTSAPDQAMHPSAVTNVGGSQPHNNMMPYLVLNFCIALQGIFPSQT